MYIIETEYIYKERSADLEKWLDTSNYSKDHPSWIEAGINEKVPVMFKDEAAGLLILEFVGFCPKCHAYIVQRRVIDEFVETEEKRCKSIKKSVVKNNMTFEDYKHFLIQR